MNAEINKKMNRKEIIEYLEKLKKKQELNEWFSFMFKKNSEKL